VVQGGTDSAAQVQGIAVAGKTGAAETPHGRTHPWFIGFAPASRPTVVVAVLLENGGVGGDVVGARRSSSAASGAGRLNGTVERPATVR
jgi:peptidoglycan glycosyltransferase